tara:strand:+ start:375 stop:578 length:204 start_codon:yes stop_codon:yes gene_type:complete
MCLLKPKKPPLPEKIEADSTPEKTAKAVVIAKKRKSVTKTPKGRRASGGSSLRIPSLGSSSGKNLNY